MVVIIMMSGRKAKVILSTNFLKIHGIIHPQHGQFHPRRPDTMKYD